MLLFWLIAGAAALVVAVLVVRPLIAGRRGAASAAEADAQVFRDQLAEVERDLARGTIGADEAEGARAEVARRLIRAAGRAEGAAPIGPAPRRASVGMAVAALIAAPVLAGGIYLALGAPGLPDRPLAERQAERPSQAEAEAMVAGRLPVPSGAADPEFLALLARLEAVVAERPDDARGQRLLGNALVRAGRWQEAHAALARHIALAGPAVTAEAHSDLAEAYILAAGGYVSPEAEDAIARALTLDPTLPPARYYAGLALRQGGRVADALAIWRRLRAESPPDAPWLEALDGIIAETDPGGMPPARGPSAADIEAAGEMSAADRAEMIAGMVARLESRLTGEGGPVEDWLRLITAYVRLDRAEDALRVYALARAAIPDASARGFLKEQALLLGLAVE